jgi:hypothetical protein
MRPLQKPFSQLRQNAVVISITHKGVYTAESEVKDQSSSTITRNKTITQNHP